MASFNNEVYDISNNNYNLYLPIYIDGYNYIPMDGIKWYNGAFGQVMCAFAVDGGDSILGGNTIITGDLKACANVSAGALSVLGSTTFTNAPVCSSYPYNSTSLVNRAYVDSLAFSAGNKSISGTIFFGNVGILTTLPAYPLDVNGTIRTTCNANTSEATVAYGTDHGLILTGAKSARSPYTMALGVDYTTGYGYINCSGKLSLFSNSYQIPQPLLLSTQGGGVLIGGSTYRTYQLEVQGYPSTNLAMSDFLVRLTNTTATGNSSILYNNVNGHQYSVGAGSGGWDYSPKGSFYIYDVTTGTKNMIIDISGNMRVANSSMIVNAIGNVGIGTTNPSIDYKLAIRSNDRPPRILLDNGDTNISCEIVFQRNSQKNAIIGYYDAFNNGTRTLSLDCTNGICLNAGGGYNGMNTWTPQCELDVNGVANIYTGTRYAITNGMQRTGSLTIGSTGCNFGGNYYTGASWTTQTTGTAGLLLECLDNTEIAVHDSGTRLASLMHYQGTSNKITIGRDMGWGVPDIFVNGFLSVGSGMDVGQSIHLNANGSGLYWGLWYSRIVDDGDLKICTDDTMRFFTGCSSTTLGTERMTILSGGTVGIGRTSPNTAYKLEVNGATFTNSLGIGGYVTGTLLTVYGGTTQDCARIYGNQTSYIKDDFPTGWGGGLATYDICCAGIYYNALQQRSDRRKKENITSYQRGLTEVLQLNPVSFNWIDRSCNSADTQYGFIAQDVQEIIPEMVGDDKEGFLHINTSIYVPILVNAIKEQQKTIETLQNDIIKIKQMLNIH